ncbi:protein CLASP-2 [Ditylenchus destructor]|nr:protein CLASP-2 [Ditylenchus destructor]
MTSRIASVTPKRGISAASSAGGLTDEQFRAAFESVPVVKVNTASWKELQSECQKISEILCNTDNDWNKRLKIVQTIRSLLVQGAANNHEFVNQCHQILGDALQKSVSDLRSQVCREACITIGFFCEKMGTNFWRLAEILLPTSINLVQNSAKIMSTSGFIANHYIAKNVRHHRILTLIVQFTSSKSKEIRRCVSSLMAEIIGNWDASILEKSWPEIMSAVKSGINDADPEVRTYARKTFENLQANYPQRADFLYQELDPAKQRTLAGRTSTSSSTHSISSERDNVPSAKHGLYGTQQLQNSFLKKRSTSDLNYKRVNMGPQTRTYRPNLVRNPAPPNIRPPHMTTPANKKLPPVASAQSSKIERASSKSSSQPGSRSTSPNRNRQPRTHIPTPSAVAHNREAHHTTSTAEHTSTVPPTRSNTTHAFQRDVVRALKNVDMQARYVRPNVVRYDEDRAFGVSPTSGFVSRNSARTNENAPASAKRTPVIKSSNGGDFESHNNHLDGAGDAYGAVNNGHNKWAYANADALAKDTTRQENMLQEICDTLSAENSSFVNEKEIDSALSTLSHIIRDDAVTLWNQFFNPVFLALLQLLSHSSTSLKIGALRTLKDLCVSQPKRFILKPELAMLNVLKAHNCEDASVVRVAEDCGAALALNLPTDTCLKLLTTVIDDESTPYHQLSGSIKMLSRVVEKVSEEEVRRLLPNIVPRMMKCYESSQSMVRRASIICLVAISNAIGIEVLKPHLNPSILKLVEVYRDRMAKKTEVA